MKYKAVVISKKIVNRTMRKFEEQKMQEIY